MFLYCFHVCFLKSVSHFSPDRYYGKEDAPVTRDYSKDRDQLRTTGLPDLIEILETVKEGLANAKKSGT